MTWILPQESNQLTYNELPTSPHLYDSVRAFTKYNDRLHSLWEIIRTTSCSPFPQLNNCGTEVMRELRSIISISDLREAGSFFTGDALACNAVTKFNTPISSTSIVLDPTCGAGNLLIAASKNLPVKETLEETIGHWGTVLFGFDIFPEFVETTKMSLILEAIKRGSEPNGISIHALKRMLPNIRKTNALLEVETYLKATHILINPPYGLIHSPESCSWGSGKVNAAGVFVEHMLSSAAPNTCFVAILPDVLRSGTRYANWRNVVDNRANHNVEIVGRFDYKTDVDVFLLSGIVGNKSLQPTEMNWDCSDLLSATKVSDHFTISVGSVVPYRDAEVGETYPYITPRTLPVWEEVEQITAVRNISGKTIKPPFVAIRRTSSPSDKTRAVATIVNCQKSVAVENHIIVAVPLEGGLSTCRQLMNVLKNNGTDKFLNKRIRCRHLTVGAIREIPWIEVI